MSVGATRYAAMQEEPRQAVALPATITALNEKLQRATYYERSGDAYVFITPSGLRAAKIWRQIKSLSADLSTRQPAERQAFVSAVTKLKEIEDSAFEDLKRRVDPLCALLCLCCRCPSLEELEMEGKVREVRQFRGSPMRVEME